MVSGTRRTADAFDVDVDLKNDGGPVRNKRRGKGGALVICLVGRSSVVAG